MGFSLSSRNSCCFGAFSAATVLLTLSVSGCARSGAVDDLSGRGTLLSDVDEAWEGGRYVPAYRSLEALAPESAAYDILWRKSRLAVSMGLAADERDEALAHFVAGRGAAWACMEAAPGFSQRRTESGWEAAVATVKPELVKCLTWGAIAWTRWLERAGPAGASMDVEAIRALYARAAEVDGEPSLLHWGGSVLEVIVAPELLPEMVAELGRAVESAPAELERVADWVLLGLVPLGQQEQALEVAAEAATMTAKSPESRNAQQRLLRWQEDAQDLSRY